MGKLDFIKLILCRNSPVNQLFFRSLIKVFDALSYGSITYLRLHDFISQLGKPNMKSIRFIYNLLNLLQIENPNATKSK